MFFCFLEEKTNVFFLCVFVFSCDPLVWFVKKQVKCFSLIYRKMISGHTRGYKGTLSISPGKYKQNHQTNS